MARSSYLRDETKQYVPKLLAAILVGRFPERYGLEVVQMTPYAYETVTVDRMTSLSVVLIAISIGLVGAFFLVAENLKSVVETVRDESTVTVFLKSSATEADTADLERKLSNAKKVLSDAPTRRLDYVDVRSGGKSLEKTYFYAANQFVWQQQGMERNPWDHAVQFDSELVSKKFPPESGFEATYPGGAVVTTRVLAE